MNQAKHIGIIMDGNGRWASSRNLPRTLGHHQGAKALKNLLHSLEQYDFESLVLFAFSEDNFKRPREEVQEIFSLLETYLQQEEQNLIKKKIFCKIIGDESLWTEKQKIQFQRIFEKTQHFTKQLYIAFAYSSQKEIFQAVQQSESFGEVSQHLYYPHQLDIIIRTGREKRLSNFLLWQLSYAEIYFSDVLWPDFSIHHFNEILQSFTKRVRRFGSLL